MQQPPVTRQETMRHCALTGEPVPQSVALSFVAAPDGTVVFDIKQNLPAERRMWLQPRRSIVRRAVEEGAFASLGHAPDDLPERIATLLERRLVETLHLLRRSGALIGGFEKVKSTIVAERAVAVAQAHDAAEDGRQKLAKLAHHHHIPVIQCLSRAQLAEVTGQENQTHLALCEGGLSRRFIKESQRFEAYIHDGNG